MNSAVNNVLDSDAHVYIVIHSSYLNIDHIILFQDISSNFGGKFSGK